MQLLVLVDYDNVKPVRRERSPTDSDFNVDGIVSAVSRLRSEFFAEYKDVLIRLYGGWTDMTGTVLERASWVARAASQVRGRRSGGRVTAELAFGLFDSPYSHLKGLYRDGGQKMVDTLMVSDAIRITTCYEAKILVMSDDEDMLPGVLACHVHQPRACVKRQALADSWHNKDMVDRSGVILHWGTI